ncbi:rapamycin-insensitive companion of mTOR-like [Seriola lalandi dorsalis]|uniref:rapamycin-insensitive companion of mTOR-like n=1 Tax=Seriola lalandi dorsalis TaxID=1841481 RepID=UPI000C6F7064|nr:rapamycin-insensitive companion of mTOR-like [Seriola lalandi dorsalis]
MAASFRGRPIRSLRMRGRNDSGEENVPLDLTREPSENFREILQNVAKPHGVSNMRKLGHLNNFIKLLCSIGHREENFGFTHEEIIVCLRLALLNEAKEVRAAGLRALRYLIRDTSVLQKVLRLQVDYLIARCIDIQQSNEGERTQALRLVRKIITVNAMLFPTSIANSLIAVGTDGLQERDRMVRAAIAIVCELALKNPEVVAKRGGLSTILKSVIDCQLSRINEALITTILHLLNHPRTRQYVRIDVELEQILAPFTDFHYRHNADTAEGQLNSYSMLLMLPNNMAELENAISPGHVTKWLKWMKSRSNKLSQEDTSEGTAVFMDNRFKPHPDFLEVLKQSYFSEGFNVDFSKTTDSANTINTYVAEKTKGKIDNLVENLAPNTVLYLISYIYFKGKWQTPFDPKLTKEEDFNVAENTKVVHQATLDVDEAGAIATAATGIGITTASIHHNPVLKFNRPFMDTEEALMMNLRDSHILNHKQNLEWNWLLIATILKWPNVNLRNNKDEQMHKFVRRLLYFYKPSSKLYAGLALDHVKARQLTVVGCQFVEFLMDSDEDGQGYLEDLVKDMVSWLSSSSGLKPERCLQSNGLLTTLSQHYFLFLGTLSAHPQGVKLLEKCGLFQCLLNLCSVKNQDAVLKLAVSTLDYSRDGLARVILSKILTAATDTCRLYATKHLRVLLRAGVEFFSSWGMELLVTQLHDHSKAVSMEALDILDEACEDKANLHALIQLKPALSHLGDKGLLLLLRFLSIPKGFSYLNERGYVSKQLDKWQKEYNLKYVDLIEEQLNEALTTYRKPVDGDNYVRRSNQRLQRPNVYLPVHLYGQLVHDKTGCHLLEAQSVVPDLSYTVRSPMLDTWEGIKQLKAALWALGNIGSSNWGLNLLQEENVIPDILTLAQHCEVLSVRGTCVYVLGVISKTRQGCEVLKQYGWDAVRHSRRTLWPVTPDEVDTQLTSELSSVPSTLSLNSESTSSRHNSESESQPNMYILDDDKCDALDQSDESSLYLHPKPVKDRSPFTILASTRFVRTRLLNSLSLPSKKLRSTSDPKTPSGSRTPTELKTGSMRRNRTVTEPSVYSPNQGDVFAPVFNGRGMQKSPTVSLETSFVGNRGGSEEHLVDGRLARGGGSGLGLSGLGGHGAVEHPSREREQSSRERLAGGDGGSSSSGGNVGSGGGGGGGTQFKSRSQSFNTDTTTSGISSMSSSPSRETVGNPEHPEPEPDSSDCVSLNTVVSAKTVKTLSSLTPQAQTNHMSMSKSSTVSLVPPGSSHTLPRRAQSLKSPSVTTIKSLADCSFMYTSPRDALGYATLKRLQQQRIHPSLSHSEALASPAKDVLFTDTITMKTGSLDSRLTPRRISDRRGTCPEPNVLSPYRRLSRTFVPWFLKALSFASLDKEELLSPINQSTLHRCSSVRSMVSSATFGCNDDYIGLALPMDINDMFHIRDSAYFQQRISPPSEERKRFLFGDGDGDRPALPVLKQQFSISELIVCRGDSQNHTVGSEETGLQDHTEENCLYCVGSMVLGYPTQPQINSTHPRTDYVDFPSWGGQSGHRLEVMPQSKFSGVSGCSDAAVSQGSICSTPTPGDIVIGGKAISEDGPASRVLLRKEVLRLIINLSSSVGTKGHETGLLTIKEKFSYAFDDICLYSEVSHLLAHCMFRLTSRRFIQELFQDVQFMPMYEEAEAILTKLPKPVEEDIDPPTES